MKTKILSICIACIIIFGLNPGAYGASKNNDSLEKRLKNSVVLYVGSPLSYISNKETRIDVDNPYVKPYIKDKTVMVPVRFISESLGGKVTIDSQEVSVSYKGKKIKYTLDSEYMAIDSKKVKMAAKAQYIEGRTFVPLEAIAEAMGKYSFRQENLIVLSDTKQILNKTKDQTLVSQLSVRISKPLTIGTEKAFKALLKKSKEVNSWTIDDRVDFADGIVTENSKKTVNSAADLQAKADTGSDKDYSKTNVQVEGVDEADTVKTDGKYIYQVNNNRVVITKADPAEKLEIESYISYDNTQFAPTELYIDGNALTVIGTTFLNVPVCKDNEMKKGYIYPPNYRRYTVKAITYDITNKKEAKKVKEFELEGRYLSSRKIGSNIYIVANKSILSWIVNENLTDIYLKNSINNDMKAYDPDGVKAYIEMQVLPSYRDSSSGDDFKQLGCKDIKYLYDSVKPDYLIIGSFNMEKSSKPGTVTALMGSGENVYASEKYLYISVNDYSNEVQTFDTDNDIDNLSSSDLNTSVYRFKLNDGNVDYSAKGKVPGTILNQFSMDESGKYFRIATTGYVSAKDYNQTNNLYVLDENMSMKGKIEGMAPGERIYSVRFMGDRAYVVTFKNVDPLFVIDLEKPESPKVLGSLKIPGYSNYLHPYDENHIIGFGKDTVENKGTAYYIGMKIAVFDVSNVEKPIEMFNEKIGGRGTDSELLNNHKALLFSKEKNLLAFPVTVMETKEVYNSDGFPQYGVFTFQGAYVYNLDLKNGLKLKGKITHISEEGYKKAGNYGYDQQNYVNRILYIKDNLFTLSSGLIKANRIPDLKEISSVKMK